METLEDKDFNPQKNDKAISIIQEKDGNWRGYMKKFGKLITLRGISPATVLELLITHNGE